PPAGHPGHHGPRGRRRRCGAAAPARAVLRGRLALQVGRTGPGGADGTGRGAVRGEVRRGATLALAISFVLSAGPVVAQPCPDCLEAGAARVSLAVPAGTPLAGYGSVARRLLVPDVLGRHAHAFWLKPSAGERDALAARALVLESGDVRVAWVALDLLAVDRAFVAEGERRVGAAGVRPAPLIVSASHTHSGPGAFVDSALLGWLALDRLDSAVREALITGVVAAVRQADAARQP